MDFIEKPKRIGRPATLKKKRINVCIHMDEDLITTMRISRHGHISDDVNNALRFWYADRAILEQRVKDLEKNIKRYQKEIKDVEK